MRRSNRVRLRFAGATALLLAACQAQSVVPSDGAGDTSAPPSPTADPAAALAGLEDTIANRGRLTYHLRSTDSIRTGRSQSMTVFDADVDGTDYSLSSTDLEVIRVGTRMFVRARPTMAWTAKEVDGGYDAVLDWWRVIGKPDDLRYQTTRIGDAGAVLEFAGEEPIKYTDPLVDLLEASMTITALEITLSPDGRPIALTFRAEGIAGSGTLRGVSVVVERSLEFSQWGADVNVTAPD